MTNYNYNSQQWINLQTSKKHLSYELLEKPAMYAHLGNLQGKSVLCLGCGSGEECDYIKKTGAGRVLGLDNAKELIEYAAMVYSECEFGVQDLNDLKLEQGAFDLIYSSLALHYVDNWLPMLQEIVAALKPGGRLLFSTHHPLKWAAKTEKSKEKNSFLMGYVKYKQQDKYEVYGDYLTPRAIEDTLLGKINITYYNKSISNIFRLLRESGLTVVDIDEPLPINQTKIKKPDFWEVHSRIPLFIIFEAVKRGGDV
jgi:SAM-dependent methyltransferase